MMISRKLTNFFKLNKFSTVTASSILDFEKYTKQADGSLSTFTMFPLDILKFIMEKLIAKIT